MSVTAAGRVWGAIGGVVLLALAGCGGGATGPANEQRIEDPEIEAAFTVPGDWTRFGEEIRAPDGTLVTVRRLSLDNGEKQFLAGLPRSMMPQLENWTKSFFILAGEPQVVDTTVAGEVAIRIVHPVKMREQSPLAEIDYWVFRYGDWLYVIRATFPTAATGADREAVDRLVGSWQFLAAGGG